MQFTIKQPQTKIEFKQYYHLRWKLLRAPWHQAEGSELDNIEAQCFHLMAVSHNRETIGIARLQFNSPTEAQIRYMAVVQAVERQGIGRELVSALEEYACINARKTVVLDAREAAVAFYHKLGYTTLKKSYLLFGEIQHYKMTKKLPFSTDPKYV